MTTATFRHCRALGLAITTKRPQKHQTGHKSDDTFLLQAPEMTQTPGRQKLLPMLDVTDFERDILILAIKTVFSLAFGVSLLSL